MCSSDLRFGTRTVIGRRWTSKGHRPDCLMKYGYKYQYLYQATQPSSGRTFECFLPNMSGECFRLFLEAFIKEHPGQMMVVDNAGSHHVNLPQPLVQKVSVEYLPAYSPDYNPQERMFQEIKKPLKGEVFYEVAAIEKVIEHMLKEKVSRAETVKKLTAWHWIV